jgi:Ca-activated chloride channel family protein
MIRMFVLILGLSFAKLSMAWTWHDLWQTRDQQAQALMNKKQFKEAAEHFKSPEWQAAALYRAGQYQAAEKLYRKQTSENAYYNQGNALALQGQYQAAIAAYDKALAINPQHEDALFNRQLLKDVLKKKQEQQEDKKAGDQKKPSEQQQQDEKSQQDKKNQQEQSATQASHQEQQAEQQQQDNKQQGNEQQAKPSKQGDKGEPKPKAAEKTKGKEAQARKNSKEEDPWLRLIPDEPGGLLREKFLRDYLQRHQGQSE